MTCTLFLRTMSSALSQLSFFSAAVNSRRLQFRRRSAQFRPRKIVNVKNSDGKGTNLSQFDDKTRRYVASVSYNGTSAQPHSAAASSSVAGGSTAEQPKKGAMIHDFCFGIPFGGLVFGEGLVGFLISRNLRTLVSGLLFGSALLALSTLSLKFWRIGKPSFPYIIGQAALSLALLFKHSWAYTSTNKFFPTGINVVISAAMLCFYAYVLIAGGNPPPKKLKPTAAVETS